MRSSCVGRWGKWILIVCQHLKVIPTILCTVVVIVVVWTPSSTWVRMINIHSYLYTYRAWCEQLYLLYMCLLRGPESSLFSNALKKWLVCLFVYICTSFIVPNKEINEGNYVTSPAHKSFFTPVSVLTMATVSSSCCITAGKWPLTTRAGKNKPGNRRIRLGDFSVKYLSPATCFIFTMRTLSS